MPDEIDRQLALERLKADIRKSAQPLKKLAEHEIRCGADPKWVAHKYNLPLDQMERWHARHLQLVEEARKGKRDP